MKCTIEEMRETFQTSYDVFESSRTEASEVWNLYHNRQYTAEQLAILSNRGQPAETFNVIKLFARLLVGYYSTVVNTITATAANYNDIDTASLLNDTISYVLTDNRFDIEGDQIKLGGLISGIFCATVDIEKTEETDDFNKPIYRCVTNHMDDAEIVLDHNSTL